MLARRRATGGTRIWFPYVPAALGGGFALADTEGAALLAETFTVNETVPCEHGGTMTVNGSYVVDFGQQGGEYSYAFDLRQKPNGCVIQTSQGQAFTP